MKTPALLLLLLCICVGSFAQKLKLSIPESADSSEMNVGIQKLARQLEMNENALDRSVRFQIEILAGHYQDALSIIDSVRKTSKSYAAEFTHLDYIVDELYAKAKLAVEETGQTFAESYSQSFKTIVGNLSDKEANH